MKKLFAYISAWASDARWRYAPSAVIALVILFLSLLPTGAFAPVIDKLPRIEGLDKLVHACLYALLTGTLLIGTPQAERNAAGTRAKAILLPLFYGFMMELGQGLLTQSRSFELRDVAANLVGSCVCVGAFVLATHLRRKHPPLR